ncbi:potassium channel, subfamily K, member 16-like isoform X2 [Stigmatopora argus]
MPQPIPGNDGTPKGQVAATWEHGAPSHARLRGLAWICLTDGAAPQLASAGPWRKKERKKERRSLLEVILDAWEQGVNPSGNSTNPSNWDFSSAFFFATTVVTTIGYGNLSPSTVCGQVFCVFYALCGIPLNLAFLKQLGKCLTIHLGRLERGVVSVVPHKQSVEALAVSAFFLTGSLLFLVLPPLLFSYVEGWTFGEGFYFAFITLSTIGFGDYVVGTDPGKEYISLYRSLAGIWIIFALAWLALVLSTGSRMAAHVIASCDKEDDEGEAPSNKVEDVSKI